MSQAWSCPRHKFPRASRVSVSYSESLTGQAVPSYLPRAVRSCGKDGNWTTPSADLSRCTLNESYKKLRWILIFGGNGFSFLFLIIALGVFFYNKQLLTLNNQIHCHFFLALCIQIIAEFLTVTYMLNLLRKTSMPVCYSLLSLLQFSKLSSFAWLLVEGFHIVLVSMWIFGLESLQLWNFGIMAWGLPMYLTVIWVFVDRVKDSLRCSGTKQRDQLHSWYIDGPILCSLAIGCGIACFCLIKLRREKRQKALKTEKPLPETMEDCVSYEEDFQKQRKTNRAFLVEEEDYQLGDKARANRHRVKIPIALRKSMVSYLVLLSYNILYTLLMYIRVPLWLKEQWILGAIIFQSLQGFVVAVVLCFLNYDVRMAFSESFRQWRIRRRPLSLQSTIGSIRSSNYSLPS